MHQRLSGRKRMRVEDLLGEKLLPLEDGHCPRSQVLPLCESSGACELPGFRATSLGTLVQMVGAGIGTTLITQIPRLRAWTPRHDVTDRRSAGAMS